MIKLNKEYPDEVALKFDTGLVYYLDKDYVNAEHSFQQL
jgi:hypothetical protein